MDKVEQGKLLRAWRKYIGDRRERPLTLAELAEQVAALAEEEGLPASSRKVPGTHASMTRWEGGKVDQSLKGLTLIAKVYGVSAVDLMMPPPDKASQPPPDNDDGQEKLVSAFRDFLKSQPKP